VSVEPGPSSPDEDGPLTVAELDAQDGTPWRVYFTPSTPDQRARLILDYTGLRHKSFLYVYPDTGTTSWSWCPPGDDSALLWAMEDQEPPGLHP
jgi:hypothetical protein